MKIYVIVMLAAFMVACSEKTQSRGAERHYQMTGKILAVDTQRQTATVEAAAIPNYMEAMTMEYPVKSKSELQKLHVGEQISATIDVTSDDSYALSNVKPQAK